MATKSAKKTSLIPKGTKVIGPQPGPQTVFLSTSADIAITGGAAGGGKSAVLLLEATRHIHIPSFSAVLFRRTLADVKKPGSIKDSSGLFYAPVGGRLNLVDLTWHFPSGSKVVFGHLQDDNTVYDWQGAQIPLIMFDELCHFSKQQFFYMLSRNRSGTCPVKPYIRASCNPDADSWVAEFISWWIDPDTGYAIPERSGVLRYFVQINDRIIWGDTRDELAEQFPEFPKELILSVTFIPSKLEDNKILEKNDPGYRVRLMSMNAVDRARLLDGNWKIRPSAGLLFQRSWCKVIEPHQIPLDGIQWVRGWDFAATPKTESNDPDWTAGVKLGRLPNGMFVVADCYMFRTTPAGVEEQVFNTAGWDGHETTISIPQDPGQAGKPIWEEEKIMMGDGTSRRLAEVRVGDFIIGKDGMPHRVSAVFEQGNLQTLRIKTQSGRSVVAAPDHPFLTPDGWVNAGDLSVGDSLALRSRPQIEASSSRQLFEFRLAGYFIGDGSVGRSAAATSTGSCHAEYICADPVQFQDFRYCVEMLGGSVVRRQYRNYHYGTKGIQQWLRDAKIAGFTAYDKHVPEWVFHGSPEQIANFLGAYFSCDGTISKSGDEIVYYSVSKRLLEEVQHLLLRIGVSSTIKEKKGKYKGTRHESFMLRMRQQDDARGPFLRRVPIFNALKFDRLTKSVIASRFRRFDDEYLPDQIVEIEDAGILPCRCLTVDDAQSFLVNDIVVHNSQTNIYAHLLSGYDMRFHTVQSNKVTRFGGFSAQAEHGNVLVVKGDWNEQWFTCLEAFPSPAHDDAVDATSEAFHRLATMPRPRRIAMGSLSA